MNEHQLKASAKVIREVQARRMDCGEGLQILHNLRLKPYQLQLAVVKLRVAQNSGKRSLPSRITAKEAMKLRTAQQRRR